MRWNVYPIPRAVLNSGSSMPWVSSTHDKMSLVKDSKRYCRFPCLLKQLANFVDFGLLEKGGRQLSDYCHQGLIYIWTNITLPRPDQSNTSYAAHVCFVAVSSIFDLKISTSLRHTSKALTAKEQPSALSVPARSSIISCPVKADHKNRHKLSCVCCWAKAFLLQVVN